MYIIACKKFDRITFASNFIRDEAIKIYSNVKNKSEVINNPIQKNNNKRMKIEFNLEKDLNYLMMTLFLEMQVGLSKEKGSMFLLNLLEK